MNNGLKPETSSLGLRLVKTLQDAGRTTTRAMTAAPLPGIGEVKHAARKLVDGLQSIEVHQARHLAISRRIANIMSILEYHLNGSEPSLELHKMVMCHQKLSDLEIKRGLNKALHATYQLEVMEMLEREISVDFQDAIFALLLQRLPPSPVQQPPPPITITEPTPDKTISFPIPEPFYDYPKITRCELSLSTSIRRTRSKSEPNSPLVRSISSGKYQGRDVLVVQYSSCVRQQDVLREFLDDVSAVVQEKHPNVLEFIGASESTTPGQSSFVVFDAGDLVSRDTFLALASCARQIFTFLEGVKSGMKCLLDHGVQTWHEIYVSGDGRAVIHPPYWDNEFSWDKSNYDVFTSLSGIARFSDFPLSTLAEILNISGPRWKPFQSAVLSHTQTAIRDYHLMHIASELDLPIPPFLLTYYGSVPDFLLTVGSVGLPEFDMSDTFHGSMSGWVTASSLWTCAGWEALHTHALDCWISSIGDRRDEDGTVAAAGSFESMSVEPLESSSDGWLSYGYFDSDVSFGVGYEMAISDMELFRMSWDRFCSTKLDGLAHLAEERQDFHAVRHMSVSVHCRPVDLRGLFPLYFHRRPSSLFNLEHYWGFYSDSPDPEITPCHMVKNMEVNYSIEINTSRADDSWAYRADRCLDAVMVKTPGGFEC